MKKICIQSGHTSIKYNCDITLRSGTGAPNEEKNNFRIVSRLCEILRTKGFEVVQTDANANCDSNITNKDWDLLLSCHCDANYAGDQGGGFVDFPEPSTDDATAESQRIAKAIESEYFKNTGIRNVPSRSNVNTRYYYMWQYLSAKTPCVILEMGESIDPHDSVILADTERVVNGIARGICRAFNVSFDVIPPVDPCANIKQELEVVKQGLVKAKSDLIALQTKTEQQLADKDKLCLQKIQDNKQKIITYVNNL